jgi:hypothetical protein
MKLKETAGMMGDQAATGSAPGQEDDPLIEGARGIAREFGAAFPEKRVYTLLERNLIPPAFRLGGRWYARRSRLRLWLASLENGGRGG